ncbi:putative Leucine-rich repeat family protein [Hibiscus syriacus]|uniref:Leucine-rich repeat family protein n=1 Tax=Hibiscus syriacus TaxID=106335 RepID=A0A6A2WF87_HIBSY|nr:putative Leucine-rich repeat family protein [Hibiscus syriacus]
MEAKYRSVADVIAETTWSKHVELDVHFVREKVALKQVLVNYVPGSHQVADGFTKSLVAARFEVFKARLGKLLGTVVRLICILVIFIKYVERTVALYLASLDKFRDSMLKNPDPGPNYAKLMEEYAYKREAELPTRIDLTPEPDKETKAFDIPPKEGNLNELEVVLCGFHYFETFKGLIVDLIFSFHERDESRDFFNRRTTEDALRVIEVELNFMYTTLYTKLKVVNSRPGKKNSPFSPPFSQIVADSIPICNGVRGGKIVGCPQPQVESSFRGRPPTVRIMNCLPWDSYRTFTEIENLDRPHGIWASVARIVLSLKKPRWHHCKCPEADDEHRHHVLATHFVRRWSGSISSHNLIAALKILWMSFFFYVSLEPFTKEQWEFIFSELKKAEFADTPETAKRISSARGEWALTDDSVYDRSNILRYVTDVPYDESILLWYIATDLFYQCTERRRTRSWKTPTMMSTVAGIAKIIFRDTSEEARIFFKRRNVGRNGDQKACDEILKVNADVEPEQVKGDQSAEEDGRRRRRE